MKFQVHSVEENKNPITNHQILTTQESFASNGSVLDIIKKEYHTCLRFLAWLFVGIIKVFVGIIKVFAVTLAAPFFICFYIILAPIVEIGEAWEKHEKERIAKEQAEKEKYNSKKE